MTKINTTFTTKTGLGGAEKKFTLKGEMTKTATTVVATFRIREVKQ